MIDEELNELDPNNIEYFNSLSNQRVAVVGRRMYTELYAYITMVQFGKFNPMTRGLLLPDPKAQKFTNIIPIRKDADQLVTDTLLKV